MLNLKLKFRVKIKVKFIKFYVIFDIMKLVISFGVDFYEFS